jgi:hypothetical protein
MALTGTSVDLLLPAVQTAKPRRGSGMHVSNRILWSS